MPDERDALAALNEPTDRLPEPLSPEQREELVLCRWGMRSRDTRGRVYEEPPSVVRTDFQRDRDRIVHSTAFRRLEYKTQVFVNHEGDHYRTRLTHTLEVAQIARAAARALGLNEDLVEAIALSHDLGHPPFGHAGEEQLNALMKNHGGFNHNFQSLRVVTALEQRYPDYPGLNLIWEIREAIVKHCGPGNNPEYDHYFPDQQPSLEAQLVDVSDSLAYSNHDIDDGIRSGYVRLDELREIQLWGQAEEQTCARWPGIDQPRLVARTVSALIDAQVLDLIQTSLAAIHRAGIETPEDARRQPQPVIGFSPPMAAMKKEMEHFLRDRLYQHPSTLRMAGKGKRFIEALFLEYVRNPAQLPEEFQKRVEKHGLERVICDYIAGMTDRFCNQEYQRFFMPFGDVGMGC